MKAFSSIHALLLAAAFFCLGPANADETKFHPFVIEMYRCQDVIQMTLDLLPLCADDAWDALSITKAAEAHAQHESEERKVYKQWNPKKPDYKALEDARERLDHSLKTSLTREKIHQLRDLKSLSDLIDEQGDDASAAYASTYAKYLRKIVSQSPVLTAKEVSGWKITLQDVSEILQAMKKNPKLASPEIQSAITLSEKALKRSPEKAEALAKQLTETLKKAEVSI